LRRRPRPKLGCGAKGRRKNQNMINLSLILNIRSGLN